MSPTPPPYPEYRLAFLGFGNVGQALAELLLEKEPHLREEPGLSFRVVGIASGSHGRAINPRGLPLREVLDVYREGTSLEGYSKLACPSTEEFIARCGADLIFETTPVNYQSGQPALDYLRQALSQGINAVTANKSTVVFGYRELSALAGKKGVRYYFESTVMDGAPVFSIARCGYPGASIESFSGILNSTTNLILNRMEAGESQQEAISYAQSIGIAETDPSGDLDGWDAAIKVAALSTVLMKLPLKPEMVDRSGIRGITPELIQQARDEGKRWKLVCSAHRDSKSPPGIRAVVRPEKVGPDSWLYRVDGTTSILEITSDVLGKLTLVEENPSPRTTAYGMLVDFLNAVS
jgi:homoserine dehydrogenase